MLCRSPPQHEPVVAGSKVVESKVRYDEDLRGGSVYVGACGAAFAMWHVAHALTTTTTTTNTTTARPGATLDAGLLTASRVQPAALVQEAVRICGECATGRLRPHRGRCTFLEGQAGPFALLAVMRYQQEAQASAGGQAGLWREPLHALLALHTSCVSRLDPSECEVLYGRAGYLWALLFARQHLPQGAVPEETIQDLVEHLLVEGRMGSRKYRWPGLMYQWHDSLYLGAIHGLAGILYVLLHVMHVVDRLDAARTGTRGTGGTSGTWRQSVREAVQSLVDVCHPSGNLPSSVGNAKDKLVQICHGAPGLLMLMPAAVAAFPEDRQAWAQATRKAADVVWERGLLRKGVGLCHGISGNAYSLLSGARALRLCGLTDQADLLFHRAQQMALFGAQQWDTLYEVPDTPASLYEGLSGLVCLLADMSQQDPDASARCPGLEL